MIPNSLIASVFLILSHIFIIPSILWTWKRKKRLWIEFSILVLIFTWSSCYHICYQTKYCFLQYNLHRQSDHYFAQLSVPLTLFYLGCVDKVYIKGLFFIFITQADFVFSAMYGAGTMLKIAICTVTLFVVSIYLIFRKCVYKKIVFRHFDWIDAILGITLGLLGFLFFELSPLNSKNYYIGHSLWHLLSFLGSYFVFESRNPDKMMILPVKTWKQWDKFIRSRCIRYRKTLKK